MVSVVTDWNRPLEPFTLPQAPPPNNAGNGVDLDRGEGYPIYTGLGSNGEGQSIMVNWFGKREKAFEDKFAHDEALKFKAHARRAKLLGLWAAELMGLGGEEAALYADELVKHDLSEPGEEDLFRKLRADFDAKGIKISDHQIRREMADKLTEAIAQVEKEG